MLMLVYCVGADAVDDKIGVSKTVLTVCLERFCDVVIENFEAAYLRTSTEEKNV